MQGRLLSTSTTSKGRRPRADSDCRNVQCSSSSQQPADYTSCVSRRSYSPQHPARYNSQTPRNSCSPQKLLGSKSHGDGSRSNASPQQSTFASRSRRNTCSRYGAYSNPTPKFQTSTSSVCLTPSTPTSRASTPPQRCHSAPRNRQLSSGGRGAESPGKIKHRRSLSSKIEEAWQFDIPEQPPNLRRTLANRSTSRVRGSDISSRHGSETGNRPRQRSVPPTLSKPANSSKTHDSDHLSSHSKSSVVSSFDDEIDSINSVISEKKLVMKTTYPGNMVGHRVTSKQELDANMREPVSKVQGKPSATDVSGGAKCLMLQTDSCEDSKSMLRSLLPTAPFYIHKECSLQYQADSMNSSVTTRNNFSSGQGACLIPSTEGSYQGLEDAGNKPVKSLASICQKEMPVLDRMPVKCENSRRYCTGHGILPSNGTIYPEKGFGRDLTVDAQEQGAGIKINEVSLSKVDTGNLCDALLDSSVNVMNTQFFKAADGYSSYQNLHLGHQQLVEDRPNINEVRNVLLQLDKMFSLNGSESLSTHFVDCQENKYSKCIRTKNVNNDGTLQDFHRVQLRNYEIENTGKHGHGSSEDVAMYEIKSNEANETDVVMHKFSAKELTESNQTNLISKVEEVKEFVCGEGRGNLELLDASSYVLDKDSLHHKVELSSGYLALGESPSKVKDYKEAALPLEAVSASWKLPNNVKSYNKQVLPMEKVSPNILGDYSGLRRSQNDKKRLTVYQTNHSVSDTYMMEQIGNSDSSKISGKKINLESITNALRINTLSDASISTSIPQSNGHQKPVRSDNVNDEVCIDYFLDMFETPNAVEAMTVRPTSSASNSMRGMDILFGASILPAVTENNMNQVAVHSENVGDEACIDTHFNDFKMKHNPDPSKGLPDGLEKISSLSSITMLSCARTPNTRLDSNTHQTSVHCQNVNEKACIDHCQDVWEMTCPAMKETLVHYEAASGGLSDGIQDENLNSLSADSSICFLQGHSPAVDVEAYVDYTITICKQDENRLHNDISILGKHVHSHDCMDSCQQSRNSEISSLQAASTTINEETHLLVVSPEEEKENITDVNLERDTCFSIQQASDLRPLHESAVAQDRKGDGMQAVQFNFQPESTHPNADLPALQTEEKNLELGAPKGNKCNKFSDVKPKHLSNQANAYEAHFSQGKIGMDTNASTGYLSRTLTLAEATDTVLFCSSIVYDLIDKATAIVMDKEKFNRSPMSVKKHRHSHRHRTSYGDTSLKPSTDKSIRQQVTQSSTTVVHGNSKPVIQVVTIPQRDAIAHARRKNPKCCCSIF